MEWSFWIATILALGLIGCAGSDPVVSPGSPPTPDRPFDEAPPSEDEVTAWTRIRLQWSASETEPGACAIGFMEFLPDGRFQEERCGQTSTGSVVAADLERLDQLVKPVLERLNSELQCGRAEIADYSEDIMVRTPASQDLQTVFSFDDSKTCFRGEREGAEDFLAAVSPIRDRYQMPFE